MTSVAKLWKHVWGITEAQVLLKPHASREELRCLSLPVKAHKYAIMQFAKQGGYY